MLNSKLVNSYYLYIKTNLKSILLVIICISIFMLHICTLFQRKTQRLIIIYLICFLFYFVTYAHELSQILNIITNLISYPNSNTFD